MRRVKTRSEPGGDGFGELAGAFIQQLLLYVVGTLIEMGEIVVSVSEVMVGGVALIMSVLCVSDTDPSPSCTKKYTDCMSTDNKYSKANSNGWGDTLCAACLRACINNGGIWNCN